MQKNPIVESDQERNVFAYVGDEQIPIRGKMKGNILYLYAEDVWNLVLSQSFPNSLTTQVGSRKMLREDVFISLLSRVTICSLQTFKKRHPHFDKLTMNRDFINYFIAETDRTEKFCPQEETKNRENLKRRAEKEIERIDTESNDLINQANEIRLGLTECYNNIRATYLRIDGLKFKQKKIEKEIYSNKCQKTELLEQIRKC